MSDMEVTRVANASGQANRTGTSKSLNWYAPGEQLTVEIAGIEVVVKYLARQGRRAKLLIVAPAGASFRGNDVGTES